MTADTHTWALAGVYALTNTTTGEQYVGSARMFGGRWAKHLDMLRAGKHINTRLQAAWEAFGEEVFRFEVLEIVSSPGLLTEREEAWLCALQPVYNIVQHAKREKPAKAVRRGETIEGKAPRLFSVSWVARRLGYSPSTVNGHLNSGRLVGFKVGGQWRVRPADLEQFIAERTNTQ